MTQIKLCGLSRPQDIATANALRPDYIGFVFAKASRRYVAPETARELRALLDPGIRAVGVFVNEAPEQVAALLSEGIIDIAQLHGAEDEEYIKRLRRLTEKPIIKAFRLGTDSETKEHAREVLSEAMASTADMVLLDSGAGTGMVLNWELLSDFPKGYILAGGLTPDNVGAAVGMLHPAAVDVSSGIETDGVKDASKMRDFANALRKDENDE
ncbi:MAG: phosphoribosylanthranilate isomerase [Lachnospiraceae bacterium]|nr:phosphoribosylanthranilate isomerase [Lachnospiraceae bacterium]